MNDAERIRVYTELMESLETLQPAPATDEAWEERVSKWEDT